MLLVKVPPADFVTRPLLVRYSCYSSDAKNGPKTVRPAQIEGSVHGYLTSFDRNCADRAYLKFSLSRENPVFQDLANILYIFLQF